MNVKRLEKLCMFYFYIICTILKMKKNLRIVQQAPYLYPLLYMQGNSLFGAHPHMQVSFDAKLQYPEINKT